MEYLKRCYPGTNEATLTKWMEEEKIRRNEHPVEEGECIEMKAGKAKAEIKKLEEEMEAKKEKLQEWRQLQELHYDDMCIGSLKGKIIELHEEVRTAEKHIETVRIKLKQILGAMDPYGTEGPASSSAYEPDEDHAELEVCTRCGKAYPEPHTDGCPRKQEEEEAIRRRWIIRKEEKEDRNKEEKIQKKLKKYDEDRQIAKEQENSGRTKREFETRTRSQNE